MSTQAKINALTAAFLKAADDIVIGVHSLGLDTPELQRPYVIKAVCAFTLENQTEGWSKSESSDKIMLDSSHKHYELIKTRVRRIMDTLKGEPRKSSSGKKEIDAVEKLLTAFNKMSKAEQKRFLKAVA